MSTERDLHGDVNRVVRSWLREDRHEDANRVLGAVLDEIDTTPQRQTTWLARRFPPMNNVLRVGLAAAAVVIIAVIAINLLPGPPVPGGEPTPSATPTSSAAPSASGPPPLGEGELSAGTYGLTVDGLEATITVPDGWGGAGGFLVGAPGDSSATVAFWRNAEAGHVYADPCQWLDGPVDPPVGPTVDDLANALANQPLRGDAVPVDISMGGYQGQMIELSIPEDINFADCDQGDFLSFEGRIHQGPGQIDWVHIIDVRGQRVVIDAHYMPGTPDAELAELQAVLDSIQFP